MIKRWVSVAAVLLLTGSFASAQDAGQRLKEMKGRVFLLRGFDAARKVHWRWDGQTFVQDPIAVHAFGGIKVTSVKLGTRSVVIKGTREVMIRDQNEKPEWIETADGEVDVDFGTGDAAALLPLVLDAIAFPTMNEAKMALPESRRESLPYPPVRKAKPVPNTIHCSCECEGETMKDGDVHRPRIVRSVEPEFSQEARSRKFSGDVLLGFKVGTDGKPSDFWILKPAPFDLTEKALEAAQQYQFAPATCKGTPVATEINVAISFTIF